MTQIEWLYQKLCKKVKELTAICGKSGHHLGKSSHHLGFSSVYVFGFEECFKTFLCQLSFFCCNYEQLREINLWKPHFVLWWLFHVWLIHYQTFSSYAHIGKPGLLCVWRTLLLTVLHQLLGTPIDLDLLRKFGGKQRELGAELP